jgi:uncharacterized protein
LKDPGGDALNAPPVVFYHAKCSDGFLAAFSAWSHFGGVGDYLPVVHADELPDCTGRPVYMLDIAFSRETMDRIEAQASRLVVLDHHQSAADSLKGFRCRCGGVHFDMDKSAARLAWEYFHPNETLPDLIAHVEDRDLLRWALADSETYLASLDFGPLNFYRMAGVMRMPADAYERFMERGSVLRQQTRKMARQLADEATTVTLAGQRGLMVNAPDLMHNVVGELLLEQCDTFALMWCLEGRGARVKVGLRAGDNFDVIPLAKAFQGGGHPYSSAFRLPVNRLGELLAGSLDP